MRGWYDTGEGEWWAVWSQDGSWAMTAEPAVDETAARAIRDARYEVNRACFSWAVRCKGGRSAAVVATCDEVKVQQIPALNGPGRDWFAVHGDNVDALSVERCEDYDACMVRLEALECPDSYALRADDMDDALELIRKEMGPPKVRVIRAPQTQAPVDTQTNEQRLAALPVDVLVKVTIHTHRHLVELTADRSGWDDDKAEEAVNDDLNDLILSLMSERADTGRSH